MLEGKRGLVRFAREKLRREAQDDFYSFVLYNKIDYQGNWHHKLIADELQSFYESETVNKLMLFVPPQHGKSELASRQFPAWAFGKDPDIKVAAASYSIGLARGFNRSIQRTIDSDVYNNVFPNTTLNSKNVASDSKGNYLRNTEEFEIIGHKGNYKAVGVMGGLSGFPVDLAIIDDPVKDRMEADSPVYRDRVWDWYLNVLEARLHNKSKVLLIMTRWHEDDLAGRLLEYEPEDWKVIKIPAIKDDNQEYALKEDPREYGAALWPEKHRLEKLLKTKKKSESVFESLYQQNPTPPEGNIIKKAWFDIVEPNEVPGGITWDMWIDGAYTKNTKNDPTGFMIMGWYEKTKTVYVKHAKSKHMEMPELLKDIDEYAELQGLGRKSRVRIEPKATGKTAKQMINANTNLSAVEIKSVLVSEGKIARAQTMAPKAESQKMKLVKGTWNQAWINQVCSFPRHPHDEYIDLGGYGCYHYFKAKKKGVRKLY